MDHEAWRRNVQGGLPRLLAAWGSLVVLSYILWSTHSRNVAVDDFRLWMAEQRAANPLPSSRKKVMGTSYSATGSFTSQGKEITVTVVVVRGEGGRTGETALEAINRLHAKCDAEEVDVGAPITWVGPGS